MIVTQRTLLWIDPQSPTQSTRAGSIDDTASTEQHVETTCTSQTHEPKVDKYKDSPLHTKEKISERRDKEKFAAEQTSAERGVSYYIIYIYISK